MIRKVSSLPALRVRLLFAVLMAWPGPARPRKGRTTCLNLGRRRIQRIGVAAITPLEILLASVAACSPAT